MKKLLIVAILSVSLLGCGKELKINQSEMGTTLHNSGYETIKQNEYLTTYNGGNIFIDGLGIVNIIENITSGQLDSSYKKIQQIHKRYKKVISETSTISEYQSDEVYVTLIKDDNSIIEIAGTGNEYFKLRSLFLKDYKESL